MPFIDFKLLDSTFRIRKKKKTEIEVIIEQIVCVISLDDVKVCV